MKTFIPTELPQGWIVTALGNCVSDFIDYRGQAPPKADSGIPLITARNVRQGFLDLSEMEYIETSAYEDWMSRGFPQPHDVLLTTEAPLGNVAQFPLDGQYALAQRIIALRGIKGVLCNQYLKYYLLSAIGQKALHIKSSGSTAIGIRQSELKKVEVYLPPIQEQNSISKILTTLDCSIEPLEQLIAAKVRLKRGLMNQLLTGKRRFKEFKGQEWVVNHFGQFLTESRIPGSDGSRARKLTVKLYGKGVVEKRDKLVGSKNTKYYIRKAGQLIYSKLDFLNGAFGIIPEELDDYESTLDLPSFDISEELDSGWLLYFITREAFYSGFAIAAEGGRKARRVNPDEFLQKKALFPSRAEQSRIAELLKNCDREINLLRKQLDLLKKQKQGLMQKLLTGQIRVKV